MKRFGVILACVMLAAILVGCGHKAQQSAQKPAEDSYPNEPKFSATAPKGTTTVKTKSGLEYQDLVVGTGETPKKGNMVFVDYVGWFTNGTRFDTSYKNGTPFDFQLGAGAVIPGWDEGVSTMKVGGTRRLVIPSNLAYGPDGNPPAIPPDATLIFVVHLLGTSKV